MTKIEGRLDKIDDKFNSINHRIDSLVSNLIVMTYEIGNKLKQKADIKATNLFLKKIILLEKIKENYKKKKQIMQKSYNKKLNILIKEDGNNVW